MTMNNKKLQCPKCKGHNIIYLVGVLMDLVIVTELWMVRKFTKLNIIVEIVVIALQKLLRNSKPNYFLFPFYLFF
jgi:hypothetical protein